MKRKDTGPRCATGFLLVMLCLHVSLRVTEASVIKNQPDGKEYQEDVQKHGKPQKHNRPFWKTAYLLTARGQNGKVVPSLHEGNIYTWWMPSTKSRFKLEDNSTTLLVPKKGLYLINLKMSYNIPTNPNCGENLSLQTSIEKYHSSYPKWIVVILGSDTMQCVSYWCQSVTLSQVVRLEKETKLRVIMKPENYGFIDGNEKTYFSVTLL